MVSNSEKHFYHHCDKTLQKVGLTDVSSKDLVNIVDGYKGKGYGQSTEEELDFICQVATSTGVLLDPSYTGKAALGMVKEMQKNPSRFKGNRILFLHTGGVYGLFDGRMSTVLQKKEDSQPSIKMWPDVEGPCPVDV